MEYFNELLKEVHELDLKDQPISKIAHEHGFEILDIKQNSNTADWYRIFHAIKKYDDYTIELTIDTKDKYRSFVNNDDEPYFNKISLFKNSKKIQSEDYTYFK